ncbi:MAG: RNA polymerase sigma factor [Myxococcota bacterium]
MSFSYPIEDPSQAALASAGASDADLMAAFKNGEHPAFNLLFDRYRDRVTSYCWRMLRNREEAEEVALETFCRVVEGAWAPKGSFRAFLFTVAHRLCLDRLRKRHRTLRFARLWRAAGTERLTPEQSVASDERRAALESALAQLPDAHRATVLLYYGQELRSQDVANIMRCSDQQVRSRLSYARRKLRSELAHLEGLTS